MQVGLPNAQTSLNMIEKKKKKKKKRRKIYRELS